MTAHRSLAVVLLGALLAIAVGCQEWRHSGPRYPASDKSMQHGMDNSRWQMSGEGTMPDRSGSEMAPMRSDERMPTTRP